MQSSHMSLSMSSYCGFSLHGIGENAEFVQLVQIPYFKRATTDGETVVEQVHFQKFLRQYKTFGKYHKELLLKTVY